MWYLIKLQIEFPCDPAVPLLGIGPKELKVGLEEMFGHPCSALLVVAKRWEQPGGPSTDEGNHRIWTGHRREEY